MALSVSRKLDYWLIWFDFFYTEKLVFKITFSHMYLFNIAFTLK